MRDLLEYFIKFRKTKIYLIIQFLSTNKLYLKLSVKYLLIENIL